MMAQNKPFFLDFTQDRRGKDAARGGPRRDGQDGDFGARSAGHLSLRGQGFSSGALSCYPRGAAADRFPLLEFSFCISLLLLAFNYNFERHPREKVLTKIQSRLEKQAPSLNF